MIEPHKTPKTKKVIAKVWKTKNTQILTNNKYIFLTLFFNYFTA